MTIQTQFSTDVFHSMQKLQHFLSGNEARQKICSQSYSKDGASPAKLQGREVGWLSFPKPFATIYSIFVRTLGHFLIFLSAREMGSRLVLQAKYASLRDDSYYEGVFGKKFLVRSINLPNLDKSDVFAHPTIRRSEIRDEKIRQLIDPNCEVLNFLNEDGVCLGECEWFAYLYFKTRHLFSDPKQHLIALANLFKDGAPVEAQVLQKFQQERFNESPHLSLSKRIFEEISNVGDDVQKIQRVAVSLLKAPPGFYAIYTTSHRLNWIKVDDNTSYLHDPNSGLIENTTVDDHIEIANVIVGTYGKSYDSTLLKIKSVSEARLSESARAA